MYNFDEIIDRQNTNSVKYGTGMMMNPDLPKDHIPMWIADMDFACPQPVLDAMKDRLDKKILGYSMLLDPEYYGAVVTWMQRRYGWTISPSSIVFSAGVIKALQVSVDKLTAPTDGVILNTPAYHPFDDAVRLYGRTPVYSPLVNVNGHYTIDFADLERKAAEPGNTLFFLCNPHNPSGRVWTEDELRRIAEICFANDVFIVSDEIHADIIREGQVHIPLAKLYPNEKRIITCTAPSKTFNLAGNHHANLIISDPDLAAEWLQKRFCGMPTALGIDACKAAYTYCDDWVKSMNDYVDENFKLVKKRLEEELPQARFNIAEGTYLAWIDMRAFHRTDKELKKLISGNGLLIEYGPDFVQDGDGFIRINLACPRSLVNKAMDILSKSLG